MAHQTVTRLFITILFCLSLVFQGFVPTWAGPYFDDGYLGLTQTELHEKLGMPQAVRDRKAALRVFTYYPIGDWDQYFKKVVSPENGEDVYTSNVTGSMCDTHSVIRSIGTIKASSVPSSFASWISSSRRRFR